MAVIVNETLQDGNLLQSKKLPSYASHSQHTEISRHHGVHAICPLLSPNTCMYIYIHVSTYIHVFVMYTTQTLFG